MRDDRERLADIVETIDTIRRHGPESLDALAADEVLAAAIIRWLAIIGEAVAGLAPTLRDAHSAVPWQEVIGMRNRLIHAYPTVSLALVWQVLEQDLDPLRVQVAAMIEELG